MRLFTVVVATSLALVGCTQTTPGGNSSTAKSSTLVVGAVASPNSMDMTTNSAAAIPQALLYNVYETLVKVDGSGKIRPLLATQWTVSSDRTVYTFKLQPKAKFASGTQVTADAVVKSFERIQQDPLVTPVAKTQMSVVSSVAAKDPATVEVTLKRPSNNWLYDVAGNTGIIIDPAGFASLAGTPAGSGPYKLNQWRKGESVVLERDPNYWGTASRFDVATFRYFADPNAMNAAMLSGDLDIISNVAAPQALSQFSDAKRFTIYEGTTNGEIVMGFNNAKKPLDDIRVRQAIIYALDRTAMRDSVWAGKGALIGSMVPPTDPWYEDLSTAYPFNPAKAKALLAEAGYAGGLSLNLRIPTLPYATGSSQFIVSQLRDVGISVTVEELEFPARWVDEVMTKSNYDMTIVSHVEGRDIVKFADPTYYWHYARPEYVDLIKRADAGSAEEQVVLMRQAAKMLSDDAAADFLWLLPSLVVAKPELSGIPANAISLSFDLTNIASRHG